jgi:ubiquinone biosynthesis monooxygenase Coq7
VNSLIKPVEAGAVTPTCPAPAPTWPDWVWTELRTNHAGETGAVWIYKGILAASRDPEVRAFAREHLHTECRHLQEVSAILPSSKRSRLVWLWSGLGWVTGALPTLFGRTAMFATIEAVETFVDQHYRAQIDRLRAESGDARLVFSLESWRNDELVHRDDAARRISERPRPALTIWTRLVGAGSALAVQASRLV